MPVSGLEPDVMPIHGLHALTERGLELKGLAMKPYGYLLKTSTSYVNDERQQPQPMNHNGHERTDSSI